MQLGCAGDNCFFGLSTGLWPLNDDIGQQNMPLSLTVRNLQQCFGNNAASNVESLTAVQAAIRSLNVSDGQTAHLGD